MTSPQGITEANQLLKTIFFWIKIYCICIEIENIKSSEIKL